MKILINIFIITILLLPATGKFFAQGITSSNNLQEGRSKKTEQVSVTKDLNIKENTNRQTDNIENKTGKVKQVKSARPDMSKSRGARPPDIVRPSGSRIPKGVGRPAGAGRHGRG